MYMDEKLIFARPSDAAAVNSAAVCLLQGDHPGWPGPGGPSGKTDGSGPYQGLYAVIRTADVIAEDASLTAKLQHCDTQDGTYTDLLALPTVTAAGADIPAGLVLGVVPIPRHSKNWLRVNLSAAAKISAFLTNAVDKHYPGVWDGSDN
jgi:hypothetical protein